MSGRNTMQLAVSHTFEEDCAVRCVHTHWLDFTHVSLTGYILPSTHTKHRLPLLSPPPTWRLWCSCCLIHVWAQHPDLTVVASTLELLAAREGTNHLVKRVLCVGHMHKQMLL